jgi:hypothetical protein
MKKKRGLCEVSIPLLYGLLVLLPATPQHFGIAAITVWKMACCHPEFVSGSHTYYKDAEITCPELIFGSAPSQMTNHYSPTVSNR